MFRLEDVAPHPIRHTLIYRNSRAKLFKIHDALSLIILILRKINHIMEPNGQCHRPIAGDLILILV